MNVPARSGAWPAVRTAPPPAPLRDDEIACRSGAIVLASDAIRRVHAQIAAVADRGLDLILLGESGVGKTQLARCYHAHAGARAAGPFVWTNLGEDSDDVKYFQRKLFGARRGASVGIDRDEPGLAQRADGGTLFLDEVGELAAEPQGALLRFLDARSVRRLGDSGATPDEPVDVRIVAGTNRDLRAMVRARRFREDLWHRLAGEVIEVPPLRARREDIAAFLRVAQVEAQGRRAPLDALLDADARAFLVREYDWPGNFRSLVHFARRASLYLDGATLHRRACEAALQGTSVTAAPPPSTPTDPPGRSMSSWAMSSPRASARSPRGSPRAMRSSTQRPGPAATARPRRWSSRS